MPSLPLALSLAVLLGPLSAQASGGPPMVTDDPGTPGDGHWEINVAALSSHASQSTTYQTPLVDANYGVGERIQLKFEMPYLRQNAADGSHESGTGDALLGVKWRFFDAGENAWQISTYPQVELHTPLSKSTPADLADTGTSYLLPLEFVRGFDGYDINFEIGRWFRPAARADSWIAGFVVTHEVRKGVELMAELHDEVTAHQSGEELILNFGARYDLSESYTLLMAAGHDLHNSIDKPNTLLTYIGLQMKF